MKFRVYIARDNGWGLNSLSKSFSTSSRLNDSEVRLKLFFWCCLPLQVTHADFKKAKEKVMYKKKEGVPEGLYMWWRLSEVCLKLFEEMSSFTFWSWKYFLHYQTLSNIYLLFDSEGSSLGSLCWRCVSNVLQTVLLLMIRTVMHQNFEIIIYFTYMVYNIFNSYSCFENSNG